MHKCVCHWLAYIVGIRYSSHIQTIMHYSIPQYKCSTEHLSSLIPRAHAPSFLLLAVLVCTWGKPGNEASTSVYLISCLVGFNHSVSFLGLQVENLSVLLLSLGLISVQRTSINMITRFHNLWVAFIAVIFMAVTLSLHTLGLFHNMYSSKSSYCMTYYYYSITMIMCYMFVYCTYNDL